jgi:hypothetical protein
MEYFDPRNATIEGPDAANMFELKKAFTFVDARGKRWTAPRGTLTDGASIPQIFLSIIGSPMHASVFNAAVVHDAYCGVGNAQRRPYQTERWRDVHRMFYEACLTSGCPPAKAKLIYVAVYFGGPRWNDTARNLVEFRAPHAAPGLPAGNGATVRLVPKAELENTLRDCSQWIHEVDPSLDELDAWVDGARAGIIGSRAQ